LLAAANAAIRAFTAAFLSTGLDFGTGFAFLRAFALAIAAADKELPVLLDTGVGFFLGFDLGNGIASDRKSVV